MDYGAPPPSHEGYGDRYPSSFGNDAPALPPEAFTRMPEARPVDMGQYGSASGHDWQDGTPGYYSRPGAAPVDTGEYGAHSGMDPAERAPIGYDHYVYRPHEVEGHWFSWGEALWTCLKFSLVIAGVSVGFELVFSFLGIRAALQGQFTLAMIWVIIALLVPAGLGGYLSGYEVREHGWLVGLITVAGWLFVFRPMYYALLAWALSGRFAFRSMFSTTTLVLVFGLFLPAGALAGWLGQKRATTGLRF